MFDASHPRPGKKEQKTCTYRLSRWATIKISLKLKPRRLIYILCIHMYAFGSFLASRSPIRAPKAFQWSENWYLITFNVNISAINGENGSESFVESIQSPRKSPKEKRRSGKEAWKGIMSDEDLRGFRRALNSQHDCVSIDRSSPSVGSLCYPMNPY